jgi:hypothetical protein
MFSLLRKMNVIYSFEEDEHYLFICGFCYDTVSSSMQKCI